MRSTLTTTSLMSDRFRVSDRATTAIATGVLHDLGIICDENMAKVIDRNKIRREKEKIRKVITEEDNQMKEVNAIYFDGRKDKTITQEKIGSKMYRRTIKEEHVSVISEPGGKYIGHVTPKNGTGNGIADSIWEHLESKGFDMSAVEAVGCYGTATNTGWRNGVIHKIELDIRCNGLYVCYILMSCHIGIYLNTWMELQQGQLHSVVQSENNSLAVRNFLL
uniref:Uncharacterized protein n=1 Tax=Homalodisca liturata TaxID=320908 RepID=A0A1B6J5V0_9HEMI